MCHIKKERIIKLLIALVKDAKDYSLCKMKKYVHMQHLLIIAMQSNQIAKQTK